MILRDHLIIDPCQLSLRKFGKQIPSDLKRGIEVPVLIPLMPHELAYQNVAINLVSNPWAGGCHALWCYWRLCQ